jgi:DNA-binding SARP family transcriptional activator
LEEDRLRIYLAGSIGVERDGRFVPQRDLPGAQGRLVFSILALERDRAVPIDELAVELWGEDPPRAWDAALRALISKVRSALAPVGIGDTEALVSALGSYQLRLPPRTWIDVEAATDATHRAESALRAGNREEANGWTLVAGSIARRPFLQGIDAPWAAQRRQGLQALRVRSLECRAQILIGKADHGLAIRDLEEVLGLEPFRETAYLLLMQAHAANGNRAEALRVYDRCRKRLSEELGADPSPEVEAQYLGILRTGRG